MVTDLVGNHIGLRELAGLAPDVARTEAPLEILKETSVEIEAEWTEIFARAGKTYKPPA